MYGLEPSMYLNSLTVERNLLSLNRICPSLIIQSMIVSLAWCSDKSRGRLQHSISHAHSRDWRYEDGEARVAKILGWVPLTSDTGIQSTCQPKQKLSDLSALESNEFICRDTRHPGQHKSGKTSQRYGWRHLGA